MMERRDIDEEEKRFFIVSDLSDQADGGGDSQAGGKDDNQL